MNTTAAGAPTWQLKEDGSEVELRLAGDWIARETGLRGAADIDQVLKGIAGKTRLHYDASSLGRWGDALVLFVQMLREALEAQRGAPAPALDESGLPEAARKLLALAAAGGRRPAAAVPPPSPSLPAQVGQAAIGAWSETIAVAALTGDSALRGLAVVRGRAWTRLVDVVELMRDAGADALAIVALVNLLVGAIIAFVGAVQLRRFGAGLYIADLTGIAIAREMAAIITAVVMAGRTGGAYAAQLAAMEGNEEIDALKALGIPIFDFLVLPRLAALVSMMPLLYIYACVIGLFGSYVVSIATLDLTSTVFLHELRLAVAGKQFGIGLAKSVTFGALVALAGCRIGLKAGRSAADVGNAATRAVVAGIVGIIALDAIFALCAEALGL
jgi:phospholipid/cholesterol/gamma-HCH transport system permease protein